MGMRTTLYGYIEEMDFWEDPIRKSVREHNFEVIGSMPEGDDWPPLSKEMFSICSNNKNFPGPNLEYLGRIIHFGANLKSVEIDWDEWKDKFELLLCRLFFLKAVVHFRPEYSGIQTNEWSIDLNRYQIKHNSEMPRPIVKEDWIFESTWRS